MNHSPSSSFSSSVITISTNNSQDFTCKGTTPTVRCLADIFRRMLCSRNLPAHPPVQRTESNAGEGIVICTEEPDFTPGIVARLMGLDSLPQNSVSKVGRSRSTSCVDCRGEERTVKSLQSFREIPKYVELHDHEFFILSFERGSEIKELRPRKRKLMKRKLMKTETDENRVEQVNSCRGTDVEPEGDVEASSRAVEDGDIDSQVTLERKNILRIKQVEADCSSDDFSPISVLDYGEFIREPATTFSDDSWSDGSKLRSSSNTLRKLSPEDQSPPHECRNSIDKKILHNEELPHIWSDNRTLLGRDMVESNWAQKGLWTIEECEGIGSELEVEIWNFLLDEVLDDRFSCRAWLFIKKIQ